MSNLTEFARRELEAAGLFAPDSDYDGALGPATMRLIETFAAEGHSGFSAGIARQLFDKLAQFHPLTPLTGADDEWNEIADGRWQNRRCFHVFKDADGVYDIEGRVFRQPNGVCFTSNDSRVPVTFPYTPQTEYVDVAGEAPG